jgi:hypothetical protein
LLDIAVPILNLPLSDASRQPIQGNFQQSLNLLSTMLHRTLKGVAGAAQVRSDEALAQGVQQGNQADMTELVNRYYCLGA